MKKQLVKTMNIEEMQESDIDQLIKKIDQIDSAAWAEQVHQYALMVKQKPKWTYTEERINSKLTDMLLNVIQNAVEPST